MTGVHRQVEAAVTEANEAMVGDLSAVVEMAEECQEKVCRLDLEEAC
jgi:hypothetical protein